MIFLTHILLEAGADIDATAASGGKTALQEAASKGNIGIAHALMKAGANVNAAAAKIHWKTA